MKPKPWAMKCAYGRTLGTPVVGTYVVPTLNQYAGCD